MQWFLSSGLMVPVFGLLLLVGIALLFRLPFVSDMEQRRHEWEEQREEQLREERAWLRLAKRGLRIREEWNLDVAALRQEVTVREFNEKAGMIVSYRVGRIGLALTTTACLLFASAILFGLFLPQWLVQATSVLLVGLVLWVGWESVRLWLVSRALRAEGKRLVSDTGEAANKQ